MAATRARVARGPSDTHTHAHTNTYTELPHAHSTHTTQDSVLSSFRYPPGIQCAAHRDKGLLSIALNPEGLEFQLGDGSWVQPVPPGGEPLGPEHAVVFAGPPISCCPDPNSPPSFRRADSGARNECSSSRASAPPPPGHCALHHSGGQTPLGVRRSSGCSLVNK
jgi:hypothetical protein